LSQRAGPGETPTKRRLVETSDLLYWGGANKKRPIRRGQSQPFITAARSRVLMDKGVPTSATQQKTPTTTTKTAAQLEN
jgi:hypothetical protein